MKKIVSITIVCASLIYLAIRGLPRLITAADDHAATAAEENIHQHRPGSITVKADEFVKSDAIDTPTGGDALVEVSANRDGFVAVRDNVAMHYSKAIKSLGLPVKREERLNYLLADRIQAAVDARNVSTAQGAHTSGDLLKAAEVARELVDQQLLLEFGDVIDKIEVIIEHQRSLRTIAQTIDPAMEVMGHPLSPAQTLSLATLFSEVYGNPRSPETYPGWAHIEYGDRISAYDKRLLDSVESILSDAQTSALKTILIGGHQSASIPKR